jgi:lipid-A-disaccharide synthase
LKIYLIAGEKSGDLHGGNLIRAMRDLKPGLECRCWGGEEMQSAGAVLDQHYGSVAIMGFWEVLKKLWAIKAWIKKCENDILQFRPDAVVLIDFAGFNLRIAKFCKANAIPVYYYISPKVWAWNTGRAHKIKKLVDKMFVIFPFEVEFYKKFNWQVSYVGNPSMEMLYAYKAKNSLADLGLSTSKPLIALLPGSRKQEIQSTLSILSKLANRFPKYQFAIAGISSAPREWYDKIHLANVAMVWDATYDLLAHSDFAVVTSGTATLETAIIGTPQVVVYKANAFSYQIARRLIKVPYISLVNLLAGKELVKELIQSNFNESQLEIELREMIENPERQAQIKQGYKELYALLGPQKASIEAAKGILAELK